MHRKLSEELYVITIFASDIFSIKSAYLSSIRHCYKTIKQFINFSLIFVFTYLRIQFVDSKHLPKSMSTKSFTSSSAIILIKSVSSLQVLND